MKKLISSLFISAMLLASCGSKDEATIINKCAFYFFDTYVCDINLYFFEDSKDVPYMKFSEGINLVSLEKYSYEQVDNKHGRVADKSNVFFTVDFDTTEIDYKNYDLFAYSDTVSNETEIFDLARRSMVNHKKIESESEFKKGNEYSVKLSDFGFHFKKYKDQYYAPVDLLSIICFEVRSFYYEDKALYALPVNNEKLTTPIKFDHQFTNTYFEHCFNIYMLTEELLSGLKGTTRKMLNNGENHTFFKDGVLKTLLPYKEKIVNSTTIEDFDKNMMEMLTKELNSGGHDNIAQVSFNSKQQYIYASEYDAVDYREADVKKERNKSVDKDDFSNFVYAYDTDKDGKKDIGYITFDDFQRYTSMNYDGTIKPGMFDLLNGENGANTLFNPNSEEYDSEHYDIKDVVVDLSANAGGELLAEEILTAWICQGKYKTAYKCPNTGTYNRVSYVYDVNNDGVYDAKDYLPSSINIYILTSNGSYSSAGILPFQCYCFNKNDNPANNIKFMGERNGGGSCALTGPNYLATGFGYYKSDCVIHCDYFDINKTPEDGTPITPGLELTLSQMVDHTGPNGINNLVCSKR